MKVLTLNHSDSFGGAARAAYRLHNALRQQAIDSRMLVNQLGLDDFTVSGPSTTFQKVVAKLGPHLAQQLCRVHKTANPVFRSPAVVPSHWLDVINGSDADLVNLHWVSKEMLTIKDIGNIAKPVVWTLHDTWPFCGAEHYPDDERWREGYSKENRPKTEKGFDLNWWVWQRKKNNWKKPMHIVTVSRWLAEKVRQSALMGNWPVTVIPNTIDTEVWQPVERQLARALMGIPGDRPVVAFGAWGAEQHRKGFDLLKSALHRLRERNVDIRMLIFGQLAPETSCGIDYPVHYTGHLNDDLSLRVMYSAADVMVVPSRVETFGQTASEAQACGTPVIAFDCTGLRDVVEHRGSGYLATPFEVDDLACGIEWAIESDSRNLELSRNARRLVLDRFSYSQVAASYIKLYKEVIGNWHEQRV